VVYGLTMRREIWSLFRVPFSVIPNAVRVNPNSLEEKNDRLVEAQRQAELHDDEERRLRRVD
jgi:hypothetical protein